VTTETTKRTFVQDRAFPALNAVRAAGALMVVLTHCAFNTGRANTGWTGAALSRLDFGVALFFILSGFLLTRPFFVARVTGARSPSVAHYLWKRALRILPLYWAVVVVALLLDPANRDAEVGVWVTHLSLTQLYRPEPLASSLTQMWSLCTEVAFYLLLPVLVLGLLRRTRDLPLRRILVEIGLLGVMGVFWQTFAATIDGPPRHYAQWLPGYLPWFLIGVAFAACSASQLCSGPVSVLERLGSDLVGCWIVGIAVFALACTDIAGPRILVAPSAWEGFFKCVLYGISGAWLVLPLVFGPEREGRIRTWLASPVPSYLGDISFGIFSIHMFVLVLAMRVLGIEVFTGHFGLVLGLVLTATLVLASLSYFWLELPFLRLKNSGPFAKRDDATAPSAATQHS